VSYVPSPAGFWKRFVAYFIDFLLVQLVLNVLMTPLLFMGDSPLSSWLALLRPDGTVDLLAAQQVMQDLAPQLVSLTAWSTIGYVGLAGAYFIGMEASKRQATLGKQLLGIRVTALDGGPPGTGRVVGRFVAASLSWLTFNLGHALAGWTREHRALHDFLAGTRVENVDPAHTAMPTWAKAIIVLNVVGVLGVALLGAVLGVFAWFQLQALY
jgi:uncharacterized RDD family membrane protein YckC